MDFSVETGVFVTIRGDGSREKDKKERYQKILESRGSAGRVPQQVALTIPPKAGLVRVQPEAFVWANLYIINKLSRYRVSPQPVIQELE